MSNGYPPPLLGLQNPVSSLEITSRSFSVTALLQNNFVMFWGPIFQLKSSIRFEFFGVHCSRQVFSNNFYFQIQRRVREYFTQNATKIEQKKLDYFQLNSETNNFDPAWIEMIWKSNNSASTFALRLLKITKSMNSDLIRLIITTQTPEARVLPKYLILNVITSLR